MVLRRLKRTGVHWLSPQRWLRRLVVWGGAIGVGAAAVLFALSADRANELFHHLTGWSIWLSLVVCPLGLATVTWITRKFFPGSQGSGIPQTIAALQVVEPGFRDRMLSLRIVVGKIGLTVLAMLSGASVGREGPTVQIGAAIMHNIGRLARFSRPDLDRGLIVAGGAAGVAAAFNTPLAGIVFAIEELSRSFEHRTNGTMLTGVIFAGITSLAVLGNYTYFGATSAELDTDESWIAVVVCGITGGLLGGIFARMLIASARGLPGRIGAFSRKYPIRFAAACGLALALIGIASGGTTFGTGYFEARQLVTGTDQLPEVYGLLKLLATAVSYISGIPGGVFAPSLAVGAGFGSNLVHVVPYAPEGAVILLGMVAYFAGVVQAPITAFVIVMEMTDNHNMVLPLMAAALLAHGTSRLVCRKPLYKALAERFLGMAERRHAHHHAHPAPLPANPAEAARGEEMPEHPDWPREPALLRAHSEKAPEVPEPPATPEAVEEGQPAAPAQPAPDSGLNPKPG